LRTSRKEGWRKHGIKEAVGRKAGRENDNNEIADWN
jgi:hypothetical protein